MSAIRYSASAIRLAPWAEQRLKGWLDEAGISSVVITSTLRTKADQARIMVDNYTVDEAAELYTGAKGRQLIAAWRRALDSASGSDATRRRIAIQAVYDAIVESGYESDHMKTSVATVDIGPVQSGLSQDQVAEFVALLKSKPKEVKVSEVFAPGTHDKAIHFPMIPPTGVSAWGDTTVPDDAPAGGEDENDSGPGVLTVLGATGVFFALGYAYQRRKRRKRR